MKNLSVFGAIMLAVVIFFSACGASNTAKGTGIGAGAGAAIGAGIGALIGHGKGAAWGAGIGAVVGGSAGALIGNKMDKQKKELEALENAKVESVNDGQAIKVTFESGILFATNKSDLNTASRSSLSQFATSLKNNPDTDVIIIGHTDNTGSDAINDPLSQKRADAVKAYLASQFVPSARLTSEGRGSKEPVADNATSVGKAQNRRVEVYIMPNAKMIQEANQGTLK
jgi:outer membrane protein OmpA-like peptidoglycan-associated protein